MVINHDHAQDNRVWTFGQEQILFFTSVSLKTHMPLILFA